MNVLRSITHTILLVVRLDVHSVMFTATTTITQNIENGKVFALVHTCGILCFYI